LASNKGDNKEANPTQESDSNDSLDKKWDAFYDIDVFTQCIMQTRLVNYPVNNFLLIS
jgi:hypothetical protein